MTKKTEEELQGLVLFASLLGNLAQGSKNKELATEREQLIELVKGWREQAERVNSQLHALRKAYEAQSEAYRSLSAQNEDLARKNEALKQKYIEVLEKLQGAAHRGKDAGV